MGVALFMIGDQFNRLNGKATRRGAFAWVGGLIAAIGFIPRTQAQVTAGFRGRTVLLMVDSPDCIYCRRWERDVEQAYLASAEGRFAPLEKRDKRHPDLQGFQGLRYTPTFLLLVDGQETGRITGYPGADFFWGEIGALLQRQGFKSEDGPTSSQRDTET